MTILGVFFSRIMAKTLPKKLRSLIEFYAVVLVFEFITMNSDAWNDKYMSLMLANSPIYFSSFPCSSSML